MSLILLIIFYHAYINFVDLIPIHIKFTHLETKEFFYEIYEKLDKTFINAFTMILALLPHGSLIFERNPHMCDAHQAMIHPFRER